jgi:hypothetical protein
MKNTIFWDMTPCSPAHMGRHAACIFVRPDPTASQHTTQQSERHNVLCLVLGCYTVPTRTDISEGRSALLDGFTLKTKAPMTLHYSQSSPTTLRYWQTSQMTLHYWQ